MPDYRSSSRCDELATDLAELALGTLSGRQRADALAHVESCPRCSEELEQLSRAADAVVLAAPDADPPIGFEVRLLEQMGASSPSRHRRFRPRIVIPVAAAAAVVGLGIGLGLAYSGAPAPTTVAGPHRSPVVSAALVENGRNVGHVVAFGGAKPWLSMVLEDSAAHGTVNCVVVTDDGVTHHVGTFVARKGYGSWISPLHVDPANLETAEIVSPSGTVIATATLG